MNNHEVPSPSTRLLEQAAMLLEAYKEEDASLDPQMGDATGSMARPRDWPAGENAWAARPCRSSRVTAMRP